MVVIIDMSECLQAKEKRILSGSHGVEGAKAMRAVGASPYSKGGWMSAKARRKIGKTRMSTCTEPYGYRFVSDFCSTFPCHQFTAVPQHQQRPSSVGASSPAPLPPSHRPHPCRLSTRDRSVSSVCVRASSCSSSTATGMMTRS